MNRGPVTAGVVFATVAVALAGSVRHVQTQSAQSYGVTDLGTLGGTFHIEAGGVNLTGPIVIPDTGGWQNWESVVVPAVGLGAGRHVLRIVMDANGPTGVFGNINYLQFSH